MFKQIFQSEPFQYLTTEFIKDPYAPFASTDAPYALQTNPTQFAEELDWVRALFVEKKPNQYSESTIHLFTRNRITYFPGAGFRDYEFDSTHGKYLNDPLTNTPLINFNKSVYLEDINLEADGSIWVRPIVSLRWYPLNVETMTWDTSIYADPNLYGGAVTLREFVIDRQNNVLIKDQGEGGFPWISVYNFTTGELIREINISGVAQQIFPEDKNHCYVYCKNGILNLINYTTGQVISALRAPIPTNFTPIFFNVGYWEFSYDRIYRRLLGIEKLANDPVTGQNTSYIRGWYPVPIPVRIMKPIPLIAPRANRTVPYLTRLFGDAGEPVSGVNVSASVTGVTSVISSPGITNDNGEAIIQAVSSVNGAATLTFTAQVT